MANDIIPLQFRQSRLNHLPCGNGGAAAIVNSATNLSSSYIVALLLLLLIHSSDDCSSSDSVLKIEKECNFFVKSISQKFREINFTKNLNFYGRDSFYMFLFLRTPWIMKKKSQFHEKTFLKKIKIIQNMSMIKLL